MNIEQLNAKMRPASAKYNYGRIALLCLTLVICFSTAGSVSLKSQQTSDQTVKLWDVTSGEGIKLPLAGRGNVNSLAYSPDGKLLAGGTGDKTVQIWDAKSGKLRLTLRGHVQSVESIAFNTDGSLLASGSYDRTIKIWDVATGRMLKTLSGQKGGILSIAFSPDGKLLASGSEDHTANVYDVRTGSIVLSMTRHQGAVTSVAFSPDGQVMTTGSRDKTVRLWDIRGGDKLGYLPFASHHDAVETIAFSPDGEVLATGSRDQTITLWSLRDGRQIRTLRGHISAVSLVVFSPDGKKLASGSYDQTVKIWDLAAGRELQTLEGHNNQVTAIAFSPNGKTLASGSALSPSNNPTLHVLAIGINDYQSPELQDQRLAVKDARDFTAALEKVGRSAFERVTNKILLDGEATKSNIIDALNQAAAEINPQDTFIFFYSGQGGLPNSDKEFALLPSDVDVEISTQSIIHASLLSTMFLKIEARHQMIVLDTVHGDKGFDSLVARINEENKELAGLLRRDLVLLAAQMSYEKIDVENGSLTYALLKGINGGASTQNGAITGKGLASYLKKAATQIKKNIFPDVSFKTFEVGDDFTLGYATRKVSANQFPMLENYFGAHFVQTKVEKTIRRGFNVSELGKRKKIHALTKSSLWQSPGRQLEPQESTRARLGANEHENRQSVLSRNGKDYALLIAVKEYDHWNSLDNPLVDAEAIEKELRVFYGFKTDILKNPTKREITKALLKYRNDLKYSDDDQLFIFFAGHGHFNDDIKEGYLIAKDSLKDDEVGDTYYSHSILRKVIDSIPCKHIFLVIDACYSGTFDEAIARRGGEEMYADATNPEFIRRKMQFKTRRFLTSGDKVYVPDGRPGEHSPFARKFLEALRGYGGRDKILTITGILAYVERVIPEPRQGEWGANEPGSDFIFETKTMQ